MAMIADVLIAWLIADLGSGLFHWFEDRYGDPDWPWPFGEHVARPNIEHHSDPFKITRSSYLARNATTLIPTVPAAAVAAWFGLWSVAAGLLWLSQANELHAWAHQKCSRPIRLLQRVGIVQSPRAHARHHARPFDRSYCVCTNYLNPILESVGFWPGLELLVAIVFRVRPRPERSSA